MLCDLSGDLSGDYTNFVDIMEGNMDSYTYIDHTNDPFADYNNKPINEKEEDISMV